MSDNTRFILLLSAFLMVYAVAVVGVTRDRERRQKAPTVATSAQMDTIQKQLEDLSYQLDRIILQLDTVN